MGPWCPVPCPASSHSRSGSEPRPPESAPAPPDNVSARKSFNATTRRLFGELSRGFKYKFNSIDSHLWFSKAVVVGNVKGVPSSSCVHASCASLLEPQVVQDFGETWVLQCYKSVICAFPMVLLLWANNREKFKNPKCVQTMCLWFWSSRKKSLFCASCHALIFSWLKRLCSVLIYYRECVVMAIQKGKYNSVAHCQRLFCDYFSWTWRYVL